jgi:hypothetical protein
MQIEIVRKWCHMKNMKNRRKKKKELKKLTNRMMGGHEKQENGKHRR